jgi:putative membrane-bound dehydrogenase-like protein
MNRKLTLPALALVFLTPLTLAAQGYSPEEALARMKLADGFRARLVASEPAIRQPVTMTFDGRGRLWVIQYLQYPKPAGLEAVKVDKYLRTVWDRVPEPPPKGPRGLDRVTILSDPDEHGRYRKSKDFVTGLNLATGLAIGHGGVWVAQPPYLLFYPDKDQDDVPDGPPEVRLKGFGMEDSHAFANSLIWGPDGWLYGAHGSTVTAHIRGIEFQQGIWRYHPLTKKFELFAEGGGNTWGLDFDRHGNVIAGTNYGGKAMLHQVQGGYYVKGFAKHGPLHNPYTYGYFEHVPYRGFKGGHVTCGGIVYQGDTFPASFRDQYIAANLLSNAIYWHKLHEKASSFTAEFGGELLVANDTWFRPIDCLVGPDGSVYVADWYDNRANHVDPVDNWDKSNGRVYKIEAKGTRPFPKLDLDKKKSDDLVALLAHPNVWYRREARRILAERRDTSVIPRLRADVLGKRGQIALESLWALYVSGGFEDALARKLLGHADEDVRTWTVRLLGDEKKVSLAMRDALVKLARTEPHPRVRSQLACTAKRLPGPDCLAIVKELLRHSEDVDDPHIPLLLWWAVEDKAVSDPDGVLALLDDRADWQRPLVRTALLERIARRYTAEGSGQGLGRCATLLRSAPGEAERKLLLAGMEKGLEGRILESAPRALEDQLQELRRKRPDDLMLLRLVVRLGSRGAYDEVKGRVANAKTPANVQAALLEFLGEVGRKDCVPLLLKVLAEARSDRVRAAALTALQPFPDPAITAAVLARYPKFSGSLKSRARSLLASRPASALALLKAVDAGKVSPKELPLDQVRQLSGHKGKEIARLVEKHWGKMTPETPGDKQARIRSIALILNRQGLGDPLRGKALFVKHCATCHQLFGEGTKLGPDLTGADRKNRNYLVQHIVDPSAFIRPEFIPHRVDTTDGRALTGLVAEATPSAVTLVDEKNNKTVIPRSKIDEMSASPVSLMPEKLLEEFSDLQLRDLFAYLQGDGPVKDKGGGK